MSLLLSVDKGNNKYRFWSTNIDEYVSDWLTRDEALEFIYQRKLEEVERQMQFERQFFPYGWADKDTKRYL